MGNLDPSLLESARSLGQKPWQVFRRVVLPLSLPGLVAGGSLVFIGAFTDLGTPLVLGYSEVVPNQIFSLVNEQTMNPAGPALVAVVTALVLALFGLTRLVSSRAGRGGGGGVKGTSRGAETSLRGWRAAAVFIFHGAVVLFAILPHLAVILGGLGERWFGTVLPESWTLEHLREALLHPIAQQGVRNSLLYASASTVLDVLLGLACAWVIVRRGGWAGRFCDALSLAPLAIPGLVLAFGYVAVYSGWYQSTPAVLPVGFFLVLSYAVRRLPYAVRACVAGLEQTPASLEEAARGLGARTGRVLSKITVPLIAANVAAGALLAFAFAMLEVSESLILANRPVDYPLTKAIYHLFGRVGDGDQIASALGLFALLFLSLSLLAAGAFLGRKWGEMFKG
jgi:iron(III) transport system permease protein